MSEDIVTRLREAAKGEELFGFDGMCAPDDPLLTEAAATIAALRAEVERLEKDAELLDWLDGEYDRELKAKWQGGPLPRSLFRANMPITRKVIRAAIAQTKERA